MNVQPFGPVQGATQALSPTTTSAALTFTGNGINSNCYYIWNNSGVAVAVKTGLASSGSVVAIFPVVGTPGDMVIPSGTVQIFSKGFTIDTIAIIASASGATGNVYITPGEGQ